MDVCPVCCGDLPQIEHACVRCAEPLSLDARVCGKCLKTPPRFDVAFCAYRYGYPIDHLIRALKFHGRLHYGRVLGELFARRLQASRAQAWPEVLLPVPLAQQRFNERGFNQAIEIGAALESVLDIPLRADTIARIRETHEQTGLDGKARRKNLRRAFAVVRKVKAKHVALVDDVITTGSTMNELARMLKRAGVKCVEAWAVARTVRG